MNKDELWKAMKAPQEKTCLNCLFSGDNNITDCYEQIGICGGGPASWPVMTKWEYDGKSK